MVPICSLSPSQSIQNLQYQCMDTSPTDGLFNYEWWGHMMKWRSRFGIGFLIVYPLVVGNGRVSCRIPMCGAYGGLYPNLSRINFLGPSFFGIIFLFQKKGTTPKVHGTQKISRLNFGDHGGKHLWIKFQWPRSCLSLCKSPTNSSPRNYRGKIESCFGWRFDFTPSWQKHQQWDKVLPIHQSAKREKGIQGMPGPAPQKKCSHHPSNKPRFCRTFNEQRHHEIRQTLVISCGTLGHPLRCEIL